jgi:hypothetical protein
VIVEVVAEEQEKGTVVLRSWEEALRKDLSGRQHLRKIGGSE